MGETMKRKAAKTNKNERQKVLRRLALCAAAGSLASTALPAAAFKFDLGGGFNGAFDSTVSYGLQMRMQGRSCQLVALDNGGCANSSAQLPEASEDAYFLNADDGDQNYNKYDLFSEVIKGTHELQLKMPYDFSFFGRVTELYDFRIGQTERTQLAPEARRFSVYNFQPLDAYVNKDFDLFGRNARLRAGWQVMSWGEDIFVLGGINSINAIDVRRAHVAGAQVKEILRPAPMVSFSSDISSNWSTEAYWQWHWNSFQLDPTGTYFSSADPVGKGNDGAIFIPTASINAGLAANPATAALLQAGVINPLPYGTFGDPGGTGLTTAQIENVKFARQRMSAGFQKGGTPAVIADTIAALALNSGTAIPLVADKGGSNHGQYGVSFRYRPDWVDASFGFYYERFNSKIPFVTYTVDTNNATYAAANPVAAAYKIEYPSGINLYGLSYNTNVGDWALGGEVSWRPRDPVAIDPSVPLGDNPSSAPYACVNAGGEAAGKYCRGWVDRSKIQVQQSFLQIFSPTEGFGGFVLNTLGAKEGYFLGELGATDYPGLDRLGGVPWSLPAYFLPNKFSAGYVFESQITYPNVMNLGFDWLPQIDWSQGVIGNTPNALPWQEGAKSATFTLNFNQHNIITAALAYSWFWGGGTQNQTSDRDYLSFTMAYNF
jgi:hypothetical protein